MDAHTLWFAPTSGVLIFRKSFATVLVTLTLVLSVVPSMLDAADVGHEILVERQHEPGDCPQSHDHSICTQVGGNHAAPPAVGVKDPHRLVTRLTEPASESEPTPASSVERRRSRAPPQV